jgi:penicillin-binding protein 2
VKIYEDLRAAQVRLGVFQSVVVGLFALLLIQFWTLQVVRGRYFRALAENNRTRSVPLAAPRGALLDRKGKVLVENRPSFNVVLTPEHSENLDVAVARLSRTLNLGEAVIRERLARRGAPFHPVVVKTDASLQDVAALEARRMELPEVSIDVVPLRSYPLASAAAHALGRVGEITERQLESKDYDGLEPGALVGQAGLESQYNRRLMGQDGSRRVVVNSRGVEMGEAAREAPVDGPSVTLTLDSDLQTAAERAFAGRAGSVIALDPQTGEILAMTSTPAYDPNRFTTGVDAALWGKLSTDSSTPLVNRVIQGQYAPGSVFKIVMATAGLEEGVISPGTTFLCPGQLAVYNTVFRCNRPGGHGYVNVHQALAQSCNVFFYQLGIRLEIARIAAWGKKLGLGAPTGVDLPHELPGLMPSPEWKLKTQRVPWYGGETVSVAIGQGQVSVTPIQLARLVAIVANGGRLVRPHLVRSIGGTPIPQEEPVDLGLKPETVEVVRSGLKAVVEEGTGWRARFKEIAVGGKTGSAQVVSKARLEKNPTATAILPHGWFVAFAPVEAPRIAMAVLVEHGGGGGVAAAPLAREILAQFFGITTPPAPGGAATTAAPEEPEVPETP